MVKLIVHQGAKSIGGNKIEIRDGDTRILLDFGHNSKISERYFANDDQLSAKPNTLENALLLGLLPRPETFGADSYCKPLAGKAANLPRVAAVFLSHAHTDHDGSIPYLHPDIPVYATAETACLYDRSTHTVKVIDEGAPVNIAGTTIELMRVDHSIPGGCAFLITTVGGCKIAYSADLRSHGTQENASRTATFLSYLANIWRPDVLLIEGTNAAEYSRDLEESGGDEAAASSIKGFLAEEIGRVLGRGKMVFVNVSRNNIDRLDTLYEIIAERDQNGVPTTLHLSAFNANVLYKLYKEAGASFDRGSIVNNLLSDNRIHFYRKSESETLELKADLPTPSERVHLLSDYYNHDSPLRKDAVMLLYKGDRKKLFELSPPRGSAYIHSDSAPFNDEMKLDIARLRALVEVLGMTYHQIHSSGHIYASQLRRAICNINPRILVPIHTERPELFLDLLEGENRCRNLDDGEELDIVCK